MAKQTKMIKFMLVILLIIPIALLTTGLVQTFVLKSKQAELANAQTQLEQSSSEYEAYKNEDEYKSSDDYLKEYHKYKNGYGDDGDVIIDITQE